MPGPSQTAQSKNSSSIEVKVVSSAAKQPQMINQTSQPQQIMPQRVPLTQYQQMPIQQQQVIDMGGVNTAAGLLSE